MRCIHRREEEKTHTHTKKAPKKVWKKPIITNEQTNKQIIQFQMPVIFIDGNGKRKYTMPSNR